MELNLGWIEFFHCYTVKHKFSQYFLFSHRENEYSRGETTFSRGETTFSRGETTSGLVTGLPTSEKRRKDDLISLTGDWNDDLGTLIPIGPRIKAASTKKCLKPPDSDVNHLDLKKAWDLPKEERNWSLLLGHLEELHRESKIADESQASLLTASCPQHNSLCSHAQNVEADPFEMTADISYSPSSYKKQSGYILILLLQ
nr:uncharacterized protein LOC125420186 [Ziziphus jujuba var. spinosa]